MRALAKKKRIQYRESSYFHSVMKGKLNRTLATQGYFVALCWLLLSCSGSGDGKFLSAKSKREKPLIRNQLLFSDFEREYSFPVWFNDSLVRKEGIRMITRKIYQRTDGLEVLDTTGSVPREIISYFFDVNGRIEKIDHRTYYDDRIINKTLFQYAKLGSRSPFQVVKIDTALHLALKEEDPDRKSDLFYLYKVKEENKDFQVYENLRTGDKLIVVSNKNLHSPLIIDKTFHPNPKDWIVLGSLTRPMKKYNVSNKVRESNVQQYVYKKGAIKKISKSEYPFKTERTFVYNLKGFCAGYIDSVFSDQSYLTRIKTSFELNDFSAPKAIVHRKINPNDTGGFTYVEGFEYEFYEK